MSERTLDKLIITGFILVGFAIGIVFSCIPSIRYDVNCDGVVNSADMLNLQKYIISQQYESGEGL